MIFSLGVKLVATKPPRDYYVSIVSSMAESVQPTLLIIYHIPYVIDNLRRRNGNEISQEFSFCQEFLNNLRELIGYQGRCQHKFYAASRYDIVDGSIEFEQLLIHRNQRLFLG